MDLIHTESLISLIECCPALWDKTDESYKNKHSHFAAWMKICNALNDDFQTLSHKEKNEFRKGVVRKWNNVRDNWMKCYRRETNNKESFRKHRRYKYFEKMSFLCKVVKKPCRYIESTRRETVESVSKVEPDSNEENAQTDEDNTPVIEVLRKRDKKIQRRQASEEQEQIVSLINTIDEEKSRIMCFFKSIAPTVDNFTDEDIVEFQYEVIKVMRNISRRNQGPHIVYLPNS